MAARKTTKAKRASARRHRRPRVSKSPKRATLAEIRRSPPLQVVLTEAQRDEIRRKLLHHQPALREVLFGPGSIGHDLLEFAKRTAQPSSSLRGGVSLTEGIWQEHLEKFPVDPAARPKRSGQWRSSQLWTDHKVRITASAVNRRLREEPKVSRSNPPESA